MQKCSYCGREYPDEAAYCLIDGEPLRGNKPKISAPPKAAAAANETLTSSTTSLKVKAIFALAVRLLGLIFLYHAFQAAVAAGSILLNGQFTEQWLQFSFRISIFQCLAYAGFGLWLVGGAAWIVRWAFREPAESNNGSLETKPAGL